MNHLQLSKQVTLGSDHPTVMDFLQVSLPLAVATRARVTRDDMQSWVAPEPEAAQAVMEAYGTALSIRDTVRAAYLQLMDRIDEAVFDAFALPDRLRKTVRRRMTEFPLSENAARYRKPWELTRHPKIRVFEAGERYH